MCTVGPHSCMCGARHHHKSILTLLVPRFSTMPNLLMPDSHTPSIQRTHAPQALQPLLAAGAARVGPGAGGSVVLLNSSVAGGPTAMR